MLNNYNIYLKTLGEINFDAIKVINTINPHSFIISKKDACFEAALKSSDILLPDGIGIVWAEKFLNGNNIKKIAGYDLFLFLMNKLNNESGSVFFLGASENTLEKIKSKSYQEYPNITIGNYSPPFKLSFSEKDSKIMCDKVNNFNPDILFVGMTAPKQEKWVYVYKNKLNANMICSIGAVFDFYAGNVKRSSAIWISLGLEWLPRLIKEPRRLFYRNFVSTPKFILDVLLIKFFKNL